MLTRFRFLVKRARMSLRRRLYGGGCIALTRDSWWVRQ